MGKIKRSWKLVKACFSLFRQNKKLIIFPILSGLTSLVILFLFVIPILVFLFANLEQFKQLKEVIKTSFGVWENPFSSPWATLISLGMIFLAYLINYFIMYFFNTGLIYCVFGYLEGLPIDTKTALRFSWQKRGVIFQFSMLSATIGVIMYLLEHISKRLAMKIASFIVGVVWTLGTFFVIPILIFEEASIKTSLRRSVELFKKLWGETIAGRVGFSAFFTILALLLIVVGALAFVLIGYVLGNVAGSSLGIGLGIGFWFLFTVFVGIILSMIYSVLMGIYRTVAYSYGVTGILPQEFPKWIFKN